MSNTIKIAKMEKDIENIKTEQGKLYVLVRDTNEKIDKKFDVLIDKIEERFSKHEEFEEKKFMSMDDKFAHKYVERAFWWTLATVGTIIIGAVLTVIIKT